MRPHILILDEPTNHLDLESVDALIEGINTFAGGVRCCHSLVGARVLRVGAQQRYSCAL